MSGFYPVCRNCAYYKPTRDGVECGLTGREPNFKVQCPNFRPNGDRYKEYVSKCKDRLHELHGNAVSVLIVGCMLGIVALISALLFSHFDAAPLYMILAMLLSIIIFVGTAKIYSNRMNSITHETCALREAEIKYAELDAKNERDNNSYNVPNTLINTAGIISHLKEQGYSPNVEVSDGVEWITFRYGQFKYYMTYVRERLQIIVGFSRDAEDDIDELVFLMAANRLMNELPQVRVYYDDRSVAIDLFNQMRYLDELRDYLSDLFALIQHASDAHRYYYKQFMEQRRAQEQHSCPTPQNDRIS